MLGYLLIDWNSHQFEFLKNSIFDTVSSFNPSIFSAFRELKKKELFFEISFFVQSAVRLDRKLTYKYKLFWKFLFHF